MAESSEVKWTNPKRTVERDQMCSWAVREAPLRICPANDAFDESVPPPLIDIIAENYKFRLTARRHIGPVPDPPPTTERRPLAPILMTSPHERQTERTAHFLPGRRDSVPKNARVFDFEAAMLEYNERIFEHQQMSLQLANRLCNPAPSPRRTGTAQRSGTPRLGYEQRIAKPPGKTMPSRQVAKQRPDVASPSLDALAGSLTIRRVGSARRPKSVKPLIRGEGEVNENRAETVNSGKRFRSPPPRTSRHYSSRSYTEPMKYPREEE
jgi:hypothetical protein